MKNGSMWLPSEVNLTRYMLYEGCEHSINVLERPRAHPGCQQGRAMSHLVPVRMNARAYAL